MRILALSDIHGEIDTLKRVKYIMNKKNPDVIVIAGDLTSFGPVKTAAEVLDTLGNSVKILAVGGNGDSKEIAELLESRGMNVHNKHVKVGDVGFVGMSGPSGISLGGIMVLNYDPINYKLDYLGDCKNTVLISHMPPADTATDVVFSGEHVGSQFIREIIEKKQPDLVICGHIHESKGTDTIGKTKIVNTGALCEGYAAVIDLDEKRKKEPKIEFLKI